MRMIIAVHPMTTAVNNMAASWHDKRDSQEICGFSGLLYHQRGEKMELSKEMY